MNLYTCSLSENRNKNKVLHVFGKLPAWRCKIVEEPIVEKSEKITVYTWKYDNGARGYAVKQKNKGWLKQKSYATKREVEECCREYKEQSAHQTVKKKKVGFSAGLRYVKDRYGAKKKDGRDKNGIEAMLALLNSCGTTPDAKREMLCLVAAVLAGYCARVSTRSYMRFLSQLQRRAPIIVVKQAPFAGEVLEYVIRSLALNTTETTNSRCFTYDEKEMKCKYTPVLPQKTSDEKITDRAFLKFKGCNKRMLPQYRDTTLMVYGWFLRGRDGKRLQMMNRWISMVIYGATRKQVVSTPVEIDGKDLAKSDCRWNKDDVKLSVIRYARYVIKESSQEEEWEAMLRAEFSRYDEIIDSHNQNSHIKIKTVERYHISMQLLALHLFLKTCVKEGDLEQSQAAEIENEWYTVLLPGCKIIGTSDFVEQAKLDKEKKVKDEFESILVEIFQKGFPNKFVLSEADNESEMWGDISNIPQKDAPTDVFVIRISVKKLIELLDQFGGESGGQWLYSRAMKLDLDYISDPKKMRIKATKSNEKGVYFTIEDMGFLPKELKSRFTEYLMRMSNMQEDKQ